MIKDKSMIIIDCKEGEQEPDIDDWIYITECLNKFLKTDMEVWDVALYKKEKVKIKW